MVALKAYIESEHAKGYTKESIYKRFKWTKPTIIKYANADPKGLTFFQLKHISEIIGVSIRNMSKGEK